MNFWGGQWHEGVSLAEAITANAIVVKFLEVLLGCRWPLTGACGYIGTQVIERLKRDYHFERILCVGVSGPKGFLPERFEFHGCYVQDGKMLRSILEKAGVDTVLRLAFMANSTRDSVPLPSQRVFGTGCCTRRTSNLVGHSYEAISSGREVFGVSRCQSQPVMESGGGLKCIREPPAVVASEFRG